MCEMYSIGREKEFMEQSLRLMNESERFKTFSSWVFDETKPCNSSKLAEAGFYFVGNKDEPDCVQCFLCLKSLDGWEESDDPWKEHLGHAPDCEFAKIKKPVKKLTVLQYLSMQQTVTENCLNHIYTKKKEYISTHLKAVQQKLASLKK